MASAEPGGRGRVKRLPTLSLGNSMDQYFAETTIKRMALAKGEEASQKL